MSYKWIILLVLIWLVGNYLFYNSRIDKCMTAFEYSRAQCEVIIQP